MQKLTATTVTVNLKEIITESILKILILPNFRKVFSDAEVHVLVI